MKTRVAVCAAAVIGAMGLSVQILAGPPAGSDTVAAVSVAAVTGVTDGDTQYTYVGSKKCKKCHMKQHKSWAKTKMGKALETLKPGNAKEAKEKHGLDPAKDYSTDPTCLKCHTVGFGHEGGYTVPDASDKKAVRKAKSFAGVGCESCHGPGSAYVKVFDEIMKSKRKYKVEELYAAGMRKIDASACTSCHNDESPTTAPGTTFDFDAKKDEGTHEHLPLKQRDG